MFNILVVDDNENTLKLMETILAQNGYSTLLAKDGEEALNVIDKNHVDLIILDIMMPNMDGYEITKLLRDSDYTLPILMATAKETFHDKKIGFLSGTDDYMVKPVNDEEMLLRISALLRRSKIARERKLTIGKTILDYDSFTVTRNSHVAEVPKKEFMLLFKLLSFQNKIFTRRQIMDEIWDITSETDERTVDVHINRLRDRFKENPDFTIITVRGLGYKAVKKDEKI